MKRLTWVLAAALMLGACATSSPAEVARAPSATGAVSEEEFKAMHTLRTDAAPERRGQPVELSDGSKGYLSLPPGAKGPLPAVIVIHEWWGLNEHVQAWADRLAAEGYAALAVDLYHGKVATTPDEALALVKAADDAEATKTLLAAHAFLKSDPRIQAVRTGSIGWCFGGGWSLQTAMAIPELSAAVIYYGHPVTDPQQLSTIKAQVLGIFGTKDKSIPPETVKAFEKALDEAGVRSRIVEYDADHAFANPSGARYDERSAASAWAETSAFLARTLKR
ncbi:MULTISPECIES: dienelactone hydrolase family protein [unclassified Corallococcus]|uniref:dienelactone hydrolase family protein n=1 Tax=unclassified Corallococcus TaxID=2685029 RepID=UPI001A8C608A|nr:MULTISPECIES: dienelactone hydrolase family protein [unclassified Corallococcus]MBN9681129.1 dienelactone hydrolase family protein [Corallococcus sp. NCSPR001]WAS87278.1 dienelactone hydrolase family protein [Corallococcus sp. NCRR]